MIEEKCEEITDTVISILNSAKLDHNKGEYITFGGRIESPRIVFENVSYVSTYSPTLISSRWWRQGIKLGYFVYRVASTYDHPLSMSWDRTLSSSILTDPVFKKAVDADRIVEAAIKTRERLIEENGGVDLVFTPQGDDFALNNHSELFRERLKKFMEKYGGSDYGKVASIMREELTQLTL